MVPMVSDESSVVAAVAAAVRFWWPLGGFSATVKDMDKPGHIHFIWKGEYKALNGFLAEITPGLKESVQQVTRNMTMRGGGIRSIRLLDRRLMMEGYFQIEVIFRTADAMGANFINTCLEIMADHLQQQANL